MIWLYSTWPLKNKILAYWQKPPLPPYCDYITDYRNIKTIAYHHFPSRSATSWHPCYCLAPSSPWSNQPQAQTPLQTAFGTFSHRLPHSDMCHQSRTTTKYHFEHLQLSYHISTRFQPFSFLFIISRLVTARLCPYPTNSVTSPTI